MRCIYSKRFGIFKKYICILREKTNANTVERRENFARYNSNESLVQKARGAGKGYFYLQQQYKRAAGCHGDGGTVKIEQ